MSGIPEIQAYTLPIASELPANVAHWKINPDRAVLLVHDMQQYFLRKIPCETMKSTLINNVRDIRDRCKKLGIPVAYTAQIGSMSTTQRGLLKDFWVAGMNTDPADKQVVENLAPDPSDWLLPKWRYSAFHHSNLLHRLREAKRDQLIICGLYAHIGVLMTAVESFSNDIETFLVADAIADFSKAHHLMTLNYSARCCAVNVFTDEVLI